MKVPLTEILRFAAEHDLTIEFRHDHAHELIRVYVREPGGGSAEECFRADWNTRTSASVSVGCGVERLRYRMKEAGSSADFQTLPGDEELSLISKSPAIEIEEGKKKDGNAKAKRKAPSGDKRKARR